MTMFALVQHHKWSIGDIERLIPFERDLFVDMLMQYLKKLAEEREKKNGR